MPSTIVLALQQFSKELKGSQFQSFNVRESWEKGDLSYKFWDVQKKIAQTLDSKGSLKKVINCSRRIRKTTTALTKSIELCLKKDNAQVRFAAPTGKMLRNIIHPIMRRICEDAPVDLKPEWKSQDGLYLFPKTRAEIHIAGCNNGHEDDLLGTAADLCVVDEAEAVDNLKYVVDDVLMPQLITGEGQLWMLLTPPKTPVHDCVEYVLEAKERKDNSYAEFDIHQSGYSKEIIEKFCQEAGGKDSTTWQRQYLCQFVVDKNFSIVPEFNDSYIEEYKADEFYQFYQLYDGMDIGVRDLTVVLFAVYDFNRATLYILDELIMSGSEMTTDKLQNAIKKKENDLWGKRIPFRVSDNNNLILLQDLGILHEMHFKATDKDSLEAMVNKVRLWVGQGKVKVSPRCQHLIGNLKYAVWDDRRKEWERSKTYGHFDALAAIMYLIRNVDTVTNPIPKMYNKSHDSMWVNPQEDMTQAGELLRKAFSTRGKR